LARQLVLWLLERLLMRRLEAALAASLQFFWLRPGCTIYGKSRG
jgi:hypothetical protein